MSSEKDSLLFESEDAKNDGGENRLVEYFFVLTSKLRAAPSVDQQNDRNSIKTMPSFPELSPIGKGADYEDDDEGCAVSHASSDHSPTKFSVFMNESFENDSYQEIIDKVNQVGFESEITARYPLQDYADNPLNDMVKSFCHVGEIQMTTNFKMPKVHYFVTTNSEGGRLYGVCLTIYEEFELFDNDDESQYTTDRSSMEYSPLVSSCKIGRTRSSIKEESVLEVEVGLEEAPVVYLPKSICILSKLPYLPSFREFLVQLYRISTTSSSTPLESYILSFCKEVPVPIPGSFEIHFCILNSNIKFWAPPANQPIVWASLLFSDLFGCLSIDNIILVWHALILERQVLLTSSQLTLIVTCAEILISLLFPFEWPHMYIPVIPQLLLPVLEAPMPFLCGVDYQTLQRAKDEGHLSAGECMVVDLDKNHVSIGKNMPSLAALPSKRRAKMEKSLELNTANWRRFDRKISYQNGSKPKGQLEGFDEAFSMASTPDSDLDECAETSTFSSLQTTTDAVQESFFRFWVSILKDYRDHLIFPSDNKQDSCGFQTKLFISRQPFDARPFLKQFCSSQLFDSFVTKCVYDPSRSDIIFFDQSIDAKKNRSMLKIKKLETPFLKSACINRGQETLKIEMEGKADIKSFSYSHFPSTFDPELFGDPRPIPREYIEELLKSKNSVFKLRRKRYIDTEDLSQSAEVAIFNCWFMLFTKVVGNELQNVVREVSTADYFTPDPQSPELNSMEISFLPLSVEKPPRRKVYQEKSPSLDSFKYEYTPMDSSRRFLHNISRIASSRRKHKRVAAARVEEARSVADAQLQLSFEALYTMRKRKLSPDTMSYKYLIESCGRCGDTERASQLIALMHEDGIVADGIVYSCLLNAFSVNNFVEKSTPQKPLDEGPVWKNGFRNHSSLNWNILSKSASASPPNQLKVRTSLTAPSDLFHVAMTEKRRSWSPEKRRSWSPMNSPKSLGIGTLLNKVPSPKKIMNQSRKSLLVTEPILNQITLGEMYLSDLFPGLVIDLNCDDCPHCHKSISISVIQSSWNMQNLDESEINCPKCRNKIRPSFSVHCSEPMLYGMDGNFSCSLQCGFLNPWKLTSHIAFILERQNIDIVLNPKWREVGAKESTIWWNLIVHFLLNRLPITFLLQGSVKTPLITPMPSMS